MFENLDNILERYEDLERRLADPEVVGQPALCAALAREHGRLAKLVTPYREYREVAGRVAEAEATIAELKPIIAKARADREKRKQSRNRPR